VFFFKKKKKQEQLSVSTSTIWLSAESATTHVVERGKTEKARKRERKRGFEKTDVDPTLLVKQEKGFSLALSVRGGRRVVLRASPVRFHSRSLTKRQEGKLEGRWRAEGRETELRPTKLNKRGK
jgi:hypothetical protein